ncbi:MAG TPA: phospholipase D-like domain-containing protein [Propionibacteriaceae bacterium]|nr:phospholipase D-like domain-containing protein [Propionibacteriaceae bacterium]
MRIFIRLTAAVLLTLLTLGTSTVAPAAAPIPYSVKPGVIFNDPKGTKAAELRIVTHVERAIDNAPKGSTIRIAQYLFDLDSSADKLIAAYKRGVNVQLLIDDIPVSEQSKRVRGVLGTNKRAGSYLTRCVNSCMSSKTSVMHAKFFLFSQTGSSRNVSMISAANLYTGNTFVSWNNVHTLVGDTTMYASLNRYFDDMLPDIDRPNYYRTTTSGIHKIYFYPRTAVPGTADVPLLDVLNHVKCTGVARGYGYQGRTVIQIAQWGWSAARLDIARRLWTLHDQGCLVQVILNNFQTGARVTQTLLRPSRKRGMMRVYNAGIDSNGNGKRDLYIHHKALIINGVWFGRPNAKVVYTGSANLTGPGLLANNEILLRVVHNGTYHAYAQNLNYIRDRWTRRVTRAPAVNPAREAKVNSGLESDAATQDRASAMRASR